MPDWRISATGTGPVPASALAAQAWPPAARPAPPRRTYLLTGTGQLKLAACARAALAGGHQVVLLPASHAAITPAGTLVTITGRGARAEPAPGRGAREGWDLAMFSSGSTAGVPRGYGFTTAQLAVVTGWYQQIYQATPDTVIVTALPATYNFTFVAGILLAARLGARLHFSAAAEHVIRDAARLAPRCDRVVILANPVILDQAALPARLPGNILADSGGAPLSAAAITSYRDRGLDLREGYRLTETASLTHFDTEASAASLGTVGAAMPGVSATISAGTPLITVTSPAVGIPLDPAEPAAGATLATTDLGVADRYGRLRLLGRADDEAIAGLWPRDTLDALGPLLGRRCALICHHQGQAHIRLLAPASAALADQLRGATAGILGIPPAQVTISCQGTESLLHSFKLNRATAG
jgi:acyl-CoA synthetase (AMP-forming)/AMP-acid ligase II